MATKIEWTNETWNPITGCSHASEGCQNCYAEKMHKRLTAMGQRKYSKPFNEVVFHKNCLACDVKGKNKMIFVNSMSDTFHKNISNNEIQMILDECEFNFSNYFQILTKRADRLPDFEYPRNVWLGTTVEMAKYKSRIDFLKQTDAKIKFLSCEPLLGDLGDLDLRGIDWVIAGGESGRNARPCDPAWVRNIQKQCKEQGVPFFFKQWGEWGVAPIKGKSPRGRKLVESGTIMFRYSKKENGALLDGKEFKEFPLNYGGTKDAE